MLSYFIYSEAENDVSSRIDIDYDTMLSKNQWIKMDTNMHNKPLLKDRKLRFNRNVIL